MFVHGTGVREPGYTETFEQIKRELHEQRPDLNVTRCFWGELLGTKLNAQGASIPLYDTARGTGDVEEEDYEIALWGLLYQDPLYELRLLCLGDKKKTDFIPGEVKPGDELHEQVRNLTVEPPLQAKLEQAGIAEVFNEARRAVMDSAPYREALRNAPQTLSPYRTAVARAIIAQAIFLCEVQQTPTIILADAALRDELVFLLIGEFGDADRSIGNWLLSPLKGLAANLSTMYMKRKRGAISDAAYPFPGDILLYQGRGGESIRNFICDCIQQAEPPVVLLTHSLGGIACVDLLILKPQPKVELLITVGSQAPYLYEINALHSLPYAKPLPRHPDFPHWLNIYDLRDFLSYVGAGVFPNRVDDVLVDNRQPFPQSHGAYWTNQATWKAIIPRIP